ASTVCAVRVTRVPQPDGSSRTVPLASSPSQATAVSGSSLVIRISPNDPARWRARDSATLHSAHSSGGDLTKVRLASCSFVMGVWVRAPRGESFRGGMACTKAIHHSHEHADDDAWLGRTDGVAAGA